MRVPQRWRSLDRRVAVAAVAILSLGLVGCTAQGKPAAAGRVRPAVDARSAATDAAPRQGTESGRAAVAAPAAARGSRTTVAPSTLLQAPTKLRANREFARRPARPHGAPDQPRTGQRLRKNLKGKISRHRTFACYPPGTDGYQADCIDNGTENIAHWGDEPYNATNHRYVWIVDELPPGSKESAWLQVMVNAFNAVAKDDRPTFVYSTTADRGGDWQGCAHQQPQIVEVCPLGAADRSYAEYSVEDATRHFTTVSLHIAVNPAATEDYYTEYKVAHEFGHMVGFAHDTDCESAMTYCSTVGAKYLQYGQQQITAYVDLYDQHPTN